MNKNIFHLKILLIISFGLLQIVAAQNKSTKDTAATSAVFEVHLPIFVVNEKKELIYGMTRDDFIVLENGRRQKVTLFNDEKNNLPFYIGVLMDTSPSMAGKMTFVKRAASDFLYTVVRLRKDKAAFMTFDKEINLIQDFTDKIDLLDKAVDKVKKVGQQNSLYDAVYQFCDEKLRNAPGSRMMVIISDGKDNFSRANLKDAIDIAQRTETVIFVISTNDNSSLSTPNPKNRKIKNPNDDVLLKLVTETGGAAFFVNDLLSLEKSFISILKNIRSQYVFTYRPTNQKYDGKERKIKVRLADVKKNKIYKIRTKTKYRMVKKS